MWLHLDDFFVVRKEFTLSVWLKGQQGSNDVGPVTWCLFVISKWTLESESTYLSKNPSDISCINCLHSKKSQKKIRNSGAPSLRSCPRLKPVNSSAVFVYMWAHLGGFSSFVFISACLCSRITSPVAYLALSFFAFFWISPNLFQANWTFPSVQ